jgi:hypothetical protein
MDKITIHHIQDLCTEFGVEFKLDTSDDKYIVYCFGPVKWFVSMGTEFTWEHYVTVSKRLAAKFPEKVYQNEGT